MFKHFKSIKVYIMHMIYFYVKSSCMQVWKKNPRDIKLYILRLYAILHIHVHLNFMAIHM